MSATDRPVPTPESRDRMARLLRRLTVGTGVVAMGGVALFGALAASTLPGRSDASASNQPSSSSAASSAGSDTASSSSSGQTATDDGGLQAPVQAPSQA